VTLLGESFSAVSARFHLVGVYALVALLVRFAQHWTGDDPSGLPLMFCSLVLFIAANSGIFGLLFQAAMAPREPLSFLRWSAALFVPIFWLLFKIGFLQVWLIALVAFAHQALSGESLSESLQTVAYWGRPFFELVARVLTLYSLPVCILARVRREARPAIRQGIAFYRACPVESGRLLLLLLAVTLLEGGLNFSLGRGVDKAPPGYAEGLVTLAGAYLSLVAFFGATRVVLVRFAAGSPEDVRRVDPASPGRRP
jgi:hypothetical protein